MDIRGLRKISAKCICPPHRVSIAGDYTQWNQEKCPLNVGVRYRGFTVPYNYENRFSLVD